MNNFYTLRNGLIIIPIQILFAFLAWNSVLYISDDETAIVKAESVDLGNLLLFHFRIFEIAATKISYYYLDTAWLYISFIFFAATLFISAKISKEIFKDLHNVHLFQIIILCSASPFLAQSLSQIDTVSQVSGAFFAIITFYFSIKNEENKYNNLIVTLSSILALASKELFLLMPLFAFFVVLKKSISNGKITLKEQANLIMLIFCVLFYLYVRNLNGGIGSLESLNTEHRYGIKSNFFALAQNFFFTIGSIFNIVPTSLIGLKYGKIVYIFFALFFSIPLVVIAIKHFFHEANSRVTLYFMWLLCIATPLIFIHAAELYVYPLYFMLVLPLISRFRYKTIYLALPLVLCSLFNIFLLNNFRNFLVDDQNQMKAAYIFTLFKEADYSLYTFYPAEWFLGENLSDAYSHVANVSDNQKR